MIDLKGTTAPQFSVDNYETLVSAFIGEKDLTKSAAQSNSQILVASAQEGRGTPGLTASDQREEADQLLQLFWYGTAISTLSICHRGKMIKQKV